MDNILVNFPTNIGDVILALPVLDRLRSRFPDATITAIASGSTRSFLMRSSLIDEIIVFDKKWRPLQKLRFCLDLRRKYDGMVDLKNTLLPLLLGIQHRTPFIRPFSEKVHIVDKYLAIAARMVSCEPDVVSDFTLDTDAAGTWQKMFDASCIGIACASLSKMKQYPAALLEKVLEDLSRDYKIIVFGTVSERNFYADILRRFEVYDLVGKTALWDVFYILKHHTRLLIGVDSSIMHMASYLDVPVVGLFGPTAPERSCPRSTGSVVLDNPDALCSPCESSHCELDNLCMRIRPQRVISAARRILAAPSDRKCSGGRRQGSAVADPETAEH